MRALRMGLGTRSGVEAAALVMREGDASSEITGWLSPRSTRLIEVAL